MPGNWHAGFGKRPTEKDPNHGHLAGGPLHSARAGRCDSSRLLTKHPAVRAWLKGHPRITLHFTPTSGSWLNLVEAFDLDRVAWSASVGSLPGRGSHGLVLVRFGKASTISTPRTPTTRSSRAMGSSPHLAAGSRLRRATGRRRRAGAGLLSRRSASGASGRGSSSACSRSSSAAVLSWCQR